MRSAPSPSPISAVSFTPAAIGHNVKTVFNMARSKGQANRILKEFQPDLVVGTGGYASYPDRKRGGEAGASPPPSMSLTPSPALLLRHSPRWWTGSWWALRRAAATMMTPEKVVVTGTPVRGDFFRYTRSEARAKLGLTDERPLVVSVWGSLGAEVMNRQMADFIALECKAGEPFHHIHGAGRDFAQLNQTLTELGVDLKAHPGGGGAEYIYDMPVVMAAADLVLCRAGASTISELPPLPGLRCWCPLPMWWPTIRPRMPGSWRRRAVRSFCRRRSPRSQQLYETASDLLTDIRRRDAMGARPARMAVPDAGEQIYQTLSGIDKTITGQLNRSRFRCIGWREPEFNQIERRKSVMSAALIIEGGQPLRDESCMFTGQKTAYCPFWRPLFWPRASA